jgi:hypothetical protein
MPHIRKAYREFKRVSHKGAQEENQLGNLRFCQEEGYHSQSDPMIATIESMKREGRSVSDRLRGVGGVKSLGVEKLTPTV